ncbi:hypothetical protein [Gimesia panareensis]|nr:hypothetical protein [Gimesia panareensis]QDU47922.1 hypothetical protein Pan110_02340 [Gimesia panareensis]
MFENGAGGNRTHNPRVLSHVLQIGSRLRIVKVPNEGGAEIAALIGRM